MLLDIILSNSFNANVGSMESNATYRVTSKGGMQLFTANGDDSLLVRPKGEANMSGDADTFQFILTEYGFFIHALKGQTAQRVHAESYTQSEKLVEPGRPFQTKLKNFHTN